jgi:hypothetical protein
MPNRYFFATAEDLRPGLARLDAAPGLRYVRCGLSKADHPEEFERGDALPSLGVATSGHVTGNPQFLVLLRSAAVEVRPVHFRSGGTEYAVDQLANPDSVVLQPGGRLADGPFVAGSVASICATKDARTLLKTVSTAITRGFTRVQSFWLGPEALKLFRGGAIRFVTSSISASRNYDLRDPRESPPNEIAFWRRRRPSLKRLLNKPDLQCA